MAERDGRIGSLNEAVAERIRQIDRRNQAVAERDGRIAGLNEAVAERDRKTDRLNQAVAERDGRIASLDRSVTKRDGQIDRLSQAVAGRDGRIAKLNQAVAKRDVMLRAMRSSTSLARNGAARRSTVASSAGCDRDIARAPWLPEWHGSSIDICHCRPRSA